MASKRFLIVPEDSSAARMPRPGATMALAILFRSARFMDISFRGERSCCGRQSAGALVDFYNGENWRKRRVTGGPQAIFGASSPFAYRLAISDGGSTFLIFPAWPAVL